MEEELTESLLFSGRDVIVIQYVENSMANELLSKYPDKSGLDFDYSQSSIWSPLVPRFNSLSCLGPKSNDLSTKLEFEDCNVFDKIQLSNIKRKICSFGLSLRSKFKKNKMVFKTSKFKSNQLPSSTPSRKGWKKVLNMTRRQFKKKNDDHHHRRRHFHPISDVTLSEYFQSKNT